MNRAQLLDLHTAMTDAARRLMDKKNHDYAGAQGSSPFANFEVAERIGICSTEEGMLVRMTDKLKRLIEFTKSGTLRVEDESVKDTHADMHRVGKGTIGIRWHQAIYSSVLSPARLLPRATTAESMRRRYE